MSVVCAQGGSEWHSLGAGAAFQQLLLFLKINTRGPQGAPKCRRGLSPVSAKEGGTLCLLSCLCGDTVEDCGEDRPQGPPSPGECDGQP